MSDKQSEFYIQSKLKFKKERNLSADMFERKRKSDILRSKKSFASMEIDSRVVSPKHEKSIKLQHNDSELIGAQRTVSI